MTIRDYIINMTIDTGMDVFGPTFDNSYAVAWDGSCAEYEPIAIRLIKDAESLQVLHLVYNSEKQTFTFIVPIEAL